MMITLRKLPRAVAVAAGVMSAQALAVDFHGYARSGPLALKVNTVSVTNVKLTLN